MHSFLRISLFLIVCLLALNGKAQNTVTIPDPAFVNWLTEHYPWCMNGNQLDTLCAANDQTADALITDPAIVNLDGIQYFVHLDMLQCIDCNIETIPALPPNLYMLICYGNNLTELPELPASLVHLNCDNNELTALPVFPAGMQQLFCSFNQITALPDLPAIMYDLQCMNNQLTVLPELPTGITQLLCSNNNLTSLPPLPEGLLTLYCEGNEIPCFDRFRENLLYIEIGNNPVTCLPNYTSNMPAWMFSLPLCEDNDPIMNVAECAEASGITGTVYIDASGNCLRESNETVLANVPVRLIDVNGLLVAERYTYTDGSYYFPYANGTYYVEVVTAGQPYVASCNTDSTVTLASGLVNGVDFALDCGPLTDLSVSAVSTTGLLFPGQTSTLSVSAGNALSVHGFDCLQNTGGTLTITVSGPVTYQSVPAGSVTPDQINGNTFTYQVSDFSAAVYQSPYLLHFTTDTTATVGDSICVTTSIVSSGSDADPSNNVLHTCFAVINSYDPNYKEAFPSLVPDLFSDPITYTIHFQNTGTAPAINIRLTDSLDAQLNLATFELMGSSHPVIASLYGNVLTFRFNDIFLADSTSNEPGSHGFVQYRIRPVDGLVHGAAIPNTAAIYFDYNDPVITNTVMVYYSTLSVDELTGKAPVVSPNPGTDVFHVQLAQPGIVSVWSLTGKHLFSSEEQEMLDIDLEDQPAGVYILRSGEHSVRLIKL